MRFSVLAAVLFVLITESFAISACGAINFPGTYTLTSDIAGHIVYNVPNSAFFFGNVESCLYINSSNVVLNCNGHGITPDTGDAIITADGSGNNGFLTNITIENCNANANSNFYSIFFYQTNNSYVLNSSLTYATDAGIALYNSSNNSITNNNASFDQYNYWIETNSSNNTLSGNTGSNSTRGIELDSGDGSTILNNILYNISNGFGDGIVVGTAYNNISNNIIYDINPSADGEGIVVPNGNNYFYNNTVFNTSGSSFFINEFGGGSNPPKGANDIFINNLAYNSNGYCFVVYFNDQANDTFINNTAYNCTNDGFSDGAWGTFINNTAYNSSFGFVLSSLNLSPTYVIGNTAYNNTYSGFSISNFNMILVNNSAYLNGQDGFFLSTGNGSFINNTAYSNLRTGFDRASGYGNDSFNGDVANNNSNYGIFLSAIAAATPDSLSNIIAYRNLRDGIIINGAKNIIITNITAYGNNGTGLSTNGLFTNPANNASVTNIVSYNNSAYGFYFGCSSSCNASNLHLYNNNQSFAYYAGAAAMTNISGMVIDSSSGAFINDSNISIIDNFTPYFYIDNYAINWSSQPATLPPGTPSFISFNNKWINVTLLPNGFGATNQTITFHWTNAEAAGYNTSDLKLYQYNYSIPTAWSQDNNSPDTINNAISAHTILTNAVYGIIQGDPPPTCRDIDSGRIQPNGQPHRRSKFDSDVQS